MPDYQYKYTLTPAELRRESKNSAIGDYYSENKPNTHGLNMAYKDTGRSVLINGQHHGEAIKKLRLEENPQEKFNAFIREQLSGPAGGVKDRKEDRGDINEELNSAYSQSVMSLILTPFSAHPDIGLPTGWLFEGHQRVDNLYRDEKEGEIYFHTTVAGYNVNTPEIAYLPGPVELLYKLEKGQFVLQYMKTDSDLIRDVFLGKKIEERVLHQRMKSRDDTELNAVAEPLLKLLGNKAIKVPEEIQTVLFTAMAKITACQSRIISPTELKKELENLKLAIVDLEKQAPIKNRTQGAMFIKSFFSPRKPVPVIRASAILEQAIALVEKIPGYKKPHEEKKAEPRKVSNDPKFQEVPPVPKKISFTR